MEFIGLIQQLFIYGNILWVFIAVLIYFIRSLKINPNNLKKNRKRRDLNEILTQTTAGEPINLILMMVVLIYLAFYINRKVGFDQTNTYFDIPAWIMAILPAIILVLVVLWNFGAILLKKPKQTRFGFENENPVLSHNEYKKLDFQRKLHHVLGWIFLASVLITGVILIETHSTNPTYEEIFANFWGESNGLQLTEHLFQSENMPLGQAIIVLWMYGELIVLLNFEITRLSQRIRFPLHKKVQKTMRYKELDTFAAFSHYAAGYFVASTILPPMLFIACFGIITFADPAASIFGIRHGGKVGRKLNIKNFKTFLPWNGKSLEGMFAGAIITLMVVIPFAGPIYGIVAMIGYVAVDLVTTKPIAISDNILIPLVTTILFILLSLLSIEATNIFGL